MARQAHARTRAVKSESDEEQELEELEARLESLISDAVHSKTSEHPQSDRHASQKAKDPWMNSYTSELRRYRAERYDLIRNASAAESNDDLFDSIELYKKLLHLSSNQFVNLSDQKQACENLCRLYSKMGQRQEYEYFQKRMQRTLDDAANIFDAKNSKTLTKQIDDSLSNTEQWLTRAPEAEGSDDSTIGMSQVEVLAARLKKSSASRSSEDVNAILKVIQANDFLCKRLNDSQMRDLCSLAYHETHQEGFYLYKENEFASKAWLLLGCSPFLNDYAGSVDIYSSTRAEKSYNLSHVIHKGGLIGQQALEGESFRTDTAIVSDDGHDDIITHNHFLTIDVEDFRTIVNTFYHDAFKLSPTQNSLDCSFMFLEDAAVDQLCLHLLASNNRCLQTLILKYNNLTAEAAKRLATLFTSNSVPLICVDLSYNRLGDEGVQKLFSALRGNSSLTSLSLRGNGITNASQVLLHDLVRRNASIRLLDINDNFIDLKFLHGGASEPRDRNFESLNSTSLALEAPAGSRAPVLGPSAGEQVSVFGASEIEGVLTRLRARLLGHPSFSGEQLVERFDAQDTNRLLVLDVKIVMDVFAKFGVELEEEELLALSSSFGMPTNLHRGPRVSRFGGQRPEFQLAYPFLVQSLVGGCEEEMRTFRQKMAASRNSRSS